VLVLTCGVDSVDLPEDLPKLLSPAPAYLADQPVVGLWPVSAIKPLEKILHGEGRHSMLAFAGAIGARAIRLDQGSTNINTPADLAAAEKRHGL
jgi:molybdopterin-guanine dinucleotide biosynthesis protein A